MTGGLVVVVVGAAVTGGAVTGGAVTGAERGGAVVVGGGAVVLVVVAIGAAGEAGVGMGGGRDFAPAEAPGCSRATVTPIQAATTPETTTATLVRRRTRASARARAAGENRSRLRFTTAAARGVPAGTGWRGPCDPRQRKGPT